jgi:TP901 family phage tail tape measure protein
MVNATRELEDAFAQLKIVTGAMDAEMEKFADTATDLAKKLGRSVSKLASSIETFSRLGYNLADASKLAEYATILANVAAVDTEEATTGLTSIIKGFNLDVSDAEHIADILVEVGQKYAVSASEMMEAYEKSGAALHATNTTLEKSAGLIAAANASVQNASTVGTALKTISARIRGSKTDLEELGENVDDLADGFSKYAKEVKALTGFDIMVEGTTNQFKDLYDIMDGIAAVWGKLSDTQQARVAEILGGTRQLQVVSSIIGNWGDAADAYATAMEAAGAATRANNIYMETATAHINQFKAIFQDLSSNLLTSGFITTIVSIGTAILSIVSTLTKLHLLLPTIATTIIIIKGLQLAKAAAQSASAVSTLAAKIIAEKGANDALAVSVANLTIKEKQLLATHIQQAIATGQLTAEEGAQILSALGLAAADGTLIVANKGLAASFKSLMASIPVWGWIALAISVVVEGIMALVSWVDSSSQSIDALDDELSELTNNAKTAANEFSNLKSNADDIIPRFAELAKGVDEFGNRLTDTNGKMILTDEEYKEFWELNNKIAEMFPELDAGLDSNGNHILALSYSVDSLTESLNAFVEAERQAANEKIAGNMKEHSQEYEER